MINNKLKNLPLPPFQWKIIALMALITIINFIDRNSIAFAISPIEQTFDISNGEFGLIAGAFGIGYMVSVIRPLA